MVVGRTVTDARPAGPYRILLVRHARARSRARWPGDDRDRPLTKAGRAQAKTLAGLAELSPARILSSPYVRCVQTMEPLGKALGLPVEPLEALAEGAGTRALTVIEALSGTSLVLCSHGDVIPPLLHALAERDGIELPDDPRLAKGSTWALEGHEGCLRSARYLEAPAPETGR